MQAPISLTDDRVAFWQHILEKGIAGRFPPCVPRFRQTLRAMFQCETNHRARSEAYPAGKGGETVMSARRGAVVAAVCGTALMAGGLAFARFEFGAVSAEITAPPVESSLVSVVAAEVAPTHGVKAEDAAKGEEPAKREDGGSPNETPIVKAALPVAMPTLATAAEPAATLATPDPEPARAQQAAAPHDC